MHRRENLGDNMTNVFKAINRIINENEDVEIIFPMHKNPLVRENARNTLIDSERIHLIEPLNVTDFQNFANRSYLILTDSGGVQEEAPSLGVPVLVLRDTTERPEGIKAGTLKLVGTGEKAVYQEVVTLLTDKTEYERMSKASNPYGDGHASERILEVLDEFID
jgi:UDP-N-acetylglucosamine 2-epimerase (non-hydrolysing)